MNLLLFRHMWCHRAAIIIRMIKTVFSSSFPLTVTHRMSGVIDLPHAEQGAADALRLVKQVLLVMKRPRSALNNNFWNRSASGFLWMLMLAEHGWRNEERGSQLNIPYSRIRISSLSSCQQPVHCADNRVAWPMGMPLREDGAAEVCVPFAPVVLIAGVERPGHDSLAQRRDGGSAERVFVGRVGNCPE
jgi:hypothetical protein